jgi:hypothetical protein
VTISPHLRRGGEALSHQAKRGVVPIPKPEPREKKPHRLARRTELKQKATRLKQTPLGHCTPQQKARIEGMACLVCRSGRIAAEPAHLIPRGHPKMTREAADDVRAVVPLCGGPEGCHDLFDEGKIDLVPYLEPNWREAQEWAAGAVGLATAMRSITGGRMPESEVA